MILAGEELERDRLLGGFFGFCKRGCEQLALLLYEGNAFVLWWEVLE